jgi:hypothetical protein
VGPRAAESANVFALKTHQNWLQNLFLLGGGRWKLQFLPPKEKWPEDVFGWFVRLEHDQNGNLNVKVPDEDDAGKRRKSAATGQSFKAKPKILGANRTRSKSNARLRIERLCISILQSGLIL